MEQWPLPALVLFQASPRSQIIQSLPMCPWSFELLSFLWSLVQVFVSKGVCVQALLEERLSLQQSSFLLSQIYACFYSHMCGDSFPALVLWAWMPGVRLGPLTPQGSVLQQRYSSQFLTAPCQCGTSPCCVFSPPTSLNVASFLYPQLQGFSLSIFQMVLSSSFLL